MQHHVVIKLAGGNELELALTDQFLDKVCVFFGLAEHSDVTHQHLKEFIWDVASNALDKLES